MKKRTFVDSGVLLTAFRGVQTEAEDAFKILEDPNREFVSSIFVKMELLSKAVYHRNEEEIRFYETFFGAVSVWVTVTEDLLDRALEEAKKDGIAATDALHLVAAYKERIRDRPRS
jgi:predicted nucleic acid-binding protein